MLGQGWILSPKGEKRIHLFIRSKVCRKLKSSLSWRPIRAPLGPLAPESIYIFLIFKEVKNLFHLFIGHLYFTSELITQVLGPLSYDHLIYLEELFIYY